MCPWELHSKINGLSCDAVWCLAQCSGMQDGHTCTAVLPHGAEVCEHNTCPEQALCTKALTLEGKTAGLQGAVGWAVGWGAGGYLC